MALIGSTEAARRLGITPSLVARYLREGRIKAVKIGKTWAIDEKALAKLDRRPRGRPKA
jgi:excisionase family DNA binding protein